MLNVREQAPTSLASVLPEAGDARNPLGPDPAVQQIISVTGGVVALIYSHGPAGLRISEMYCSSPSMHQGPAPRGSSPGRTTWR